MNEGKGVVNAMQGQTDDGAGQIVLQPLSAIDTICKITMIIIIILFKIHYKKHK